MPNGSSEKDEWLQRVLGVHTTHKAPVKKVQFSDTVTVIPPPQKPKITIGEGRGGSGKVIKPKVDMTPPVKVTGSNGKKMEIAKLPDGRVTLKSPPPRVQEITFSGGGGKGAALPGAVHSLEKSGVLKDLKTVMGASVGSMTAALVAAGITGDEFEQVGNDPTISSRVKQGKNMAQVIFGGGLSGEGLETLVRDKMNDALGKRIQEYVEGCIKQGTQPDDSVVAVLQKLKDGKGKVGPTFRDLRTVSKFIPAVKEVSISGSFMGAVTDDGKLEKGNKHQLVMFNADTEPDLEVSLVVHASASLPPVFNPVDIPLSSGITGRFQDGGVMNNAPTTDGVGATRNLDPIPEQGNLTFVFEEKASKEILEGTAKPRSDGVGNKITKTNLAANDYAKNRTLADTPDDVVMVPLTYEVPRKILPGKKKKDFTGLISGTTNFDMSLKEKLKLQELTEDATTTTLKKKLEPQTREFANAEQMLICIPRSDLEELAKQDFEGAKDALKFRDDVATQIEILHQLAQQFSGESSVTTSNRLEVNVALGELEKLSSGNTDRQGFVAREMNKSGKLDTLLDAVRKDDDTGSGMLEASYAVNDMVKAQAHAKTVLRELIYPKMVSVDPKGAGGKVLGLADAILRAVKSPEDVNEGLNLAIKHFKSKSDKTGRHGHKEFAAGLEKYLMKV